MDLADFLPRSALTLDAPGVYMGLGKGRTPVYVGQSAHVKARIRQHLGDKRKKWTERVKEWVVKPLSGGLDARLEAETMLILKYRPRWNKAVKIGVRADGSLYELQFLKSEKGY